jgi:ADP-ribose pyrophosphatase YjhB (NUDIX family)
MTREYPALPLIGIGAVVLRRDSVLLVRRGKPPSAGSWSIPGGAQEVGETAESAARRELLEETGLQVGPLHLLTHVDSIHRDAAGRVQYHYTILDFAAEWVSGEPIAGSDVTEAGFFAFDALAPLKLWTEAYRVIGLARTKFGLL